MQCQRMYACTCLANVKLLISYLLLYNPGPCHSCPPKIDNEKEILYNSGEHGFSIATIYVSSLRIIITVIILTLQLCASENLPHLGLLQ
jgi:hypothetical protein